MKTAPTPELRGGSISFLQNFLQNPSGIQGLLPQASDLQRQTAGAYSNFLGQPTAQSRTFDQLAPILMQQLQGTPGQSVLNAANPIFQRNLQQSADILRQNGPRFASGTENLIGQGQQRALQDYNLFTQNVVESGLQRQQGVAGLLRQLAGGVDQAQLAGLAGAGGFANQQFGQQLGFLGPLLEQMFGASFGGGGITTPAALQQQQPWWQQALGVAGALAPLAAAPFTGGASLAALPSTLGMFNSGQMSAQNYFGLPPVSSGRLP
mgnify:CR=1 FL=1